MKNLLKSLASQYISKYPAFLIRQPLQLWFSKPYVFEMPSKGSFCVQKPSENLVLLVCKWYSQSQQTMILLGQKVFSWFMMVYDFCI
jgi:hypothetical protein